VHLTGCMVDFSTSGTLACYAVKPPFKCVEITTYPTISVFQQVIDF